MLAAMPKIELIISIRLREQKRNMFGLKQKRMEIMIKSNEMYKV